MKAITSTETCKLGAREVLKTLLLLSTPHSDPFSQQLLSKNYRNGPLTGFTTSSQIVFWPTFYNATRSFLELKSNDDCFLLQMPLKLSLPIRYGSNSLNIAYEVHFLAPTHLSSLMFCNWLYFLGCTMLSYISASKLFLLPEAAAPYLPGEQFLSCQERTQVSLLHEAFWISLVDNSFLCVLLLSCYTESYHRSKSLLQ